MLRDPAWRTADGAVGMAACARLGSKHTRGTWAVPTRGEAPGGPGDCPSDLRASPLDIVHTAVQAVFSPQVSAIELTGKHKLSTYVSSTFVCLQHYGHV